MLLPQPALLVRMILCQSQGLEGRWPTEQECYGRPGAPPSLHPHTCRQATFGDLIILHTQNVWNSSQSSCEICNSNQGGREKTEVTVSKKPFCLISFAMCPQLNKGNRPPECTGTPGGLKGASDPQRAVQGLWATGNYSPGPPVAETAFLFNVFAKRPQPPTLL